MNNVLLLALMICTSSLAFSQKKKVEIEGDTIKVDGAPYALIIRKAISMPVYIVQSLDGTPLMNWQYLDFTDVRSDRRVTYFQVTFYTDKQQCEINPGMATFKAVAKCIVENDLIKNGTIDQEAENNFVLINGKKFSEQQRSSGGL